MKRILSLLTLVFLVNCSTSEAGTISLHTNFSADATASGFNDNFSTIADVINGNISGAVATGATINILANSVAEIEMADDANPRIYANETLGIGEDTDADTGTAFVSTGHQCTDVTSNITITVTTGTTYINGFRINTTSALTEAMNDNATRLLWIDTDGNLVETAVGATPSNAASLLCTVVTSGADITSLTDERNTRIPNLVIPTHYRAGLIVSRDSNTVVRVTGGLVEMNNTIVEKTSDTTLSPGTNGDWADGSAADGAFFVGIDASGNIKFDETAPTNSDFLLARDSGKRRYKTANSTTYRVLGWVSEDAGDIVRTYGYGNIKEQGVGNAIYRFDSTANTLDDTAFTNNGDIQQAAVNFYTSGGLVSINSFISSDSVSSVSLQNYRIAVDGVDVANSLAVAQPSASHGDFVPITHSDYLSVGFHDVTIEGRVDAGSVPILGKHITVVEH